MAMRTLFRKHWRAAASCLVVVAAVCVLGFVVSKSDPACIGERHEYHSLGFGIEHHYEGVIAPGMDVKIMLSCDHLRFTITGAVKQVITSAQITKAGEEMVELASLIGDVGAVDLDSDFNFDGYNDLSSLSGDGQGWQAIDTYVIFLYDPVIGKFVHSLELSDLANIGIDKEKKVIFQEYCPYDPSSEDRACERTYFSFKDGILIKGETVSIDMK